MEKTEKSPYILIVDDNPINLQFISNILDKNGYRVGIEESGMTALESVQTEQPDLILLDIIMPEMDGFETCEHLKKAPLAEQIPIIFLTAKKESEYIIKGFRCGAVDFLTKPFNTEELLMRIGTHLRLKFSEETVVQQRNELNELVHILSHDLTNHIVSMIAGLKIIKRKPERFDHFYDSIYTSGSHGLDLIKLVRTLRAISDGKVDLTLSNLNLSEAFKNSCDSLSQQLEQKKIQLLIDVDEEIQVIAERCSLISSVFNNLLSNAIKFSYPGSAIVIQAEEQEEEVVITIKDSGIGIPKDLLENIFKMDKPTTRFGTEGEEGTGFGMPLVKKFITIYGGRIEIFSEEKTELSNTHGTEVKITLKRA